MQLTQNQRIVAAMCALPSKEWWYATDFMQPRMQFDNAFYVGYEASSRMSKLSTKYHYMFEVAKDGKYRIMRFKYEDLAHIINQLDQDDAEMLAVLKSHLVTP